MTESSKRNHPAQSSAAQAAQPDHQTVTLPQALQIGIAHHRNGSLDQAEEMYRKIIEADARFADAFHLLGALMHQRGQHADALEQVEEAMRLNPGQSFYHNTRGRIYLALGKVDEAVVDLERAVELEPQNAEAHFNLAETLMLRGRVAEAGAVYHRALTLRPIFAQAAAGFGNTRRAQGDLGGALPYYQLASALEPKSFPFAFSLAQAFHMLGHLDLAVERYEKLLADHPDRLEARLNLASSYTLMGNKAKGIEQFEILRKQSPYQPVMLDGLYEARRQACDWREIDGLEADAMRVLRGALQANKPTGFRGFTVLYLPTTATEIRDNNRLICQQMAQGLSARQWEPRERGERLRIGYLTADVKEHPTAHLILELFELHDTRRFEIFLYSWAADDKSAHRSRIKATTEHFVECYRLPDKEIAERIEADRIDVLIDLMGHTADNRLGVLARRPAPVQLGYLGYPGPYGGLVDYVIADPVVLPESLEADETVEAVARLPHCYQINSHRRIPLGPVPTRSQVGLPADGFVFCCMNNSYKLDTYVFNIWCRLLERVPGSVLWLLQGPQEMTQNLREAAREQGIDSKRLIFAPRVDRQSHLTRLQCADLFLDTRFYNAHTTATDALWAGVPVLTVRGRSFSARVAASLVSAVGLSELIMPDWQAYETEALRLVSDVERLSTLRKALTDQRTSAALFDTPRLVLALEELYEETWGRFVEGGAPASFTVVDPQAE